MHVFLKTIVSPILILAYLRLVFKKPLPDTLRHIDLFEDFNKTLHPEIYGTDGKAV